MFVYILYEQSASQTGHVTVMRRAPWRIVGWKTIVRPPMNVLQAVGYNIPESPNMDADGSLKAVKK